jgi:hypothetical protein
MVKKWNLMALFDNRSADGGEDVDRGQRLYVAMLILAGMIAIAELATRSFRE